MTNPDVNYYKISEETITQMSESSLKLLKSCLDNNRATFNREIIDSLSYIGRIDKPMDQTAINLFIGRIAGANSQLSILEMQVSNALYNLSYADKQDAEEAQFFDGISEGGIDEPVGDSPTETVTEYAYGHESLREELESQGVIRSARNVNLDQPIGGETE